MAADPESIRVGRYEGELYRADAERRVVLLPGVGYTVQGPLLWFARDVAVARGYGVLAITETARQSTDPFAWAQDAARAALAYRPVERHVVIGKSLASAAASVVSAEAVPALWLTPLLNQPVVAQSLDRSAAAVWLVGSDADPTWDHELAWDLASRVDEFRGLDHSLQVPGDPVASLRALGDVVQVLADFLDEPHA
jgi:hypothetical protein